MITMGVLHCLETATMWRVDGHGIQLSSSTMFALAVGFVLMPIAPSGG